MFATRKKTSIGFDGFVLVETGCCADLGDFIDDDDDDDDDVYGDRRYESWLASYTTLIHGRSSGEISPRLFMAVHS